MKNNAIGLQSEIGMNIKDRIRKNTIGLLLLNEWHRLFHTRRLKRERDLSFIYRKYKEATGRELNIDNPVRYTEKIQWLKVFYRNPYMPVCSDKYEVRKYLRKRGYGYLLNELYAVVDNPDNIDINDLPNKFVIKATHGSGWNFICRDKAHVKWFLYKLIMKSWLKQNLFFYGREWNYKVIKPRIIIEKYIENEGEQLTDYKFFCFDGVVKYIQVDRDRFTDHKQSFFDVNWQPMNFTVSNEFIDEKIPDEIEEMIKIATDLSQGFPHVRVDLYDVNHKIYFGEMTFFDGSGFYSFHPDSIDFEWGKQLKLPKANANLKLKEYIKQTVKK